MRDDFKMVREGEERRTGIRLVRKEQSTAFGRSTKTECDQARPPSNRSRIFWREMKRCNASSFALRSKL
jgi:hypothetical protein